jgi:hypothetical protein
LYTEPAGIQHEIVHIAEYISEIHPAKSDGHKGFTPEIYSTIVISKKIGELARSLRDTRYLSDCSIYSSEEKTE